jgi:hypothetical protein
MMQGIQDAVSVQVARGAASMSFFAFMFAASFGLFLSLFQDHTSGWLRNPWLRALIKCAVFVGLFFLVMASGHVHSCLVKLYGWLSHESY